MLPFAEIFGRKQKRNICWPDQSDFTAKKDLSVHSLKQINLIWQNVKLKINLTKWLCFWPLFYLFIGQIVYVTVCQRRWKGQHFCIRNISSKVHFLFWAVKVSLWVRFPYSVGYIISGFPESEIQPPFVSNCQHLQTPLVHMCTTIS